MVKFPTFDTIKVPRGVKLPAFPVTKILPVPDARVRLPGPSSVLKKVIGWFEVVKEPEPVTVNGPLNCIAPTEVIAEESEVPPVPSCMNAPAIEPVAPTPKVRRPVFVMVTGPVPVVVKGLLKTMALPFNEMPAAPVVERAPLNVAVPVPAF